MENPLRSFAPEDLRYHSAAAEGASTKVIG